MRVLSLVVALVAAQALGAAERVAQIMVVNPNGGGPLLVNGAHLFLMVPPQRPTNEFIEQMLPGGTFFVYTTGEVDQAIAKSSTEIAQRHDALAQQVATSLQQTDAKLRQEVIRAVDALPQRILSDAAAQAIKDAVLQQLREEMAQLRKDLEARIDSIVAPQD